ncbi:hypothetical protein QBC37DRAFT_374002 [Rhypophila decipiens]|uniref:Uncharacterized protein n=1 Tax=Rhypophila decipiens TaxID=261697 RepID=A0AAN6Y8U0_9PEZI|nr:hypothetical protein QBC37DRAFT_374002 [Rhypophila decipiens]
MAGLPSVPGLPQKPVHTNLPLTQKDREAAGAAGASAASKVSTEGGVPPRRQGYQNQPRSSYSDRYSRRSPSTDRYPRRSPSGDGYSRRSPSTDRYDRYSHRSAEPRASTNYNDRFDRYPPRSAEPRASYDHNYRPQSHSSFRGDPSHRHHPYSRPRGSAEPTTPADLKQPQAATQRRAENPFSIRPDREPEARGRGRLAPLPRSGRDRQPAGQASAKPHGERDRKVSVPVTTTTTDKKRKASAAAAPPSPSGSDLEEGEVLEEGEIVERPMKRQRTASVAASAASSSSSARVSTDKTANKGKRATPRRAFSPIVSAAAAPVATSRPVTSRSTRKSALPTPTARPSTSSSAASRASGSAGVMTWVQTLNEDVPAPSSGPAPASVDLADSSAAPASAPAPASLSVDTTLGKSPAKASVSPPSALVSPVSSGAASDLAIASAAAASPAPASESAASAVSPVSPGPASELAAVTAAAPANVSVASAVIPAAETESPSTESSVHEKEYPSTSKSPQASPSAGKSPSAGSSTSTARSARKSAVLGGKSLPGSEQDAPHENPAGKSLPETKPTSPRKSSPAPKTGGGVKTGCVAKAKPKPKAKGKRGRPKKAEPEEPDHPYVGGKTFWTGGSWSPHAKMASSSGGENEDQMQIDKTNHVDEAGVSSGGAQDDEPSPAPTTKPYATKKVPTPSSGGEEASILASIETGDSNADLVNPEATSSSAHPAVGGKTSWVGSTPEPEDDDVLLGDEPDISSIQMPGPLVAIPTAVDEGSDKDEDYSTELTVLSKTDDAVWLDVRLGSAARQIQVDAIVLPGFSTWWSRQEPDQPLYELDLSGVLVDANGKAERVITAEEVLHMLERMLLEMEKSVEGGPAPDYAKCKPYSTNHIWLAALMHSVLGLPQEVIKGMLSTIQGLWTDCREDGFPSDDALLLDAGLEKAIAAAETFGWDTLWRKMISRLAYGCIVRGDGRLIHSGLVIQDNIRTSTIGIILAARHQMVMAMTDKAMTYVQTYTRTETVQGGCGSSRCSTSRIGAVYSALTAAGLFPWPRNDQFASALAGGRSTSDISTALKVSSNNLGGTANLLNPHAHLVDLCSVFPNPLANLYKEVGSEIVDKLVTYFKDMPLGGY